MFCTVCAAVNREEDKFCGTCGARLDHRLTDRKLRQSAAGLKCSDCGKVNELGHRYCVACGTDMERIATNRRAPGFERPHAIANASLPTPEIEVDRQLEPLPIAESVEIAPLLLPPQTPVELIKDVPRTRPRVSTPSFLGLNDAGDVSYLLRDERPARRGLRKVILLAVLACLSTVAFLRWRPLYQANPKVVQQSFLTIVDVVAAWGHQQKPSSPATNAATTESAADQSTNQEHPAAGDNDAPNPAAETQNAGNQPQAVSASKGPGRQPAASAAADTDARGRTSVASETPNVHAVHVSAHGGVASGRRASSFALVRAQQFLHGKGVPQNCEQGMVYLRAAARGNDPAAAVQMGALYSSGHCVRQDRVVAYRWFNSAREQEPYNQWIQQDLDQLWARMTTQERKQIAN